MGEPGEDRRIRALCGDSLLAVRLLPALSGAGLVVLKDGTVLTWSRRYRGRAEGLF
jgi:hypothetical protein